VKYNIKKKKFMEIWLILKGKRRVGIGDAHQTDWRVKVVSSL
jgi:hypothetical protein